jgi:hypothetical protein
MNILIKEIKPDLTEYLVYVMDNKTPIEAHIFNPNELNDFIDGLSSMIKLNVLEVEKMTYDEYMNQQI